MDWRVLGRRVLIDPISGVITWISPSGPHVGLAETTADIVKEACQFINCRVRSMRDMCWRRPEDPRNTSVEADASFYVGAKADQWYTVYERGRATVEEFEIRTPPDLVVEVEITHLDQDKPSRYAELGVQEMWQANLPKGKEFSAIEVVVLDLQARCGPREIRESLVIPGINAATLPKAYQLAGGGKFDELRSLLRQEIAARKPVQYSSH